MDEPRAIALGFVISVLAGLTVAVLIAFIKREYPAAAADL